MSDTRHSFEDQLKDFSPPSGPKCSETKIFLPAGQKGIGGSFTGAGCSFSTVGHWVDENGDGSYYVTDGYVWTCPNGSAFLPGQSQ